MSIEPGGKFFGEAAELPEKEVVTLKDKSTAVKGAAKADKPQAVKSA
ncbi:hypothetical protein OGZ01_21800 [Vibrio harveyi]|nr:hypothetical protein [Vibrio harveyi]